MPQVPAKQTWVHWESGDAWPFWYSWNLLGRVIYRCRGWRYTRSGVQTPWTGRKV